MSTPNRLIAVRCYLPNIWHVDEWQHGGSKAAANAVMKSLAVDLGKRGFTVVVIHPGVVTTDMAGPSAHIDAPESVAAIRAIIAGLGPEDGGRFINYDGMDLPW